MEDKNVSKNEKTDTERDRQTEQLMSSNYVAKYEWEKKRKI